MSVATAVERAARIGVVGVGAMGMAMARNLHAKGWHLSTRDVRAEADDEARAAGFDVCASSRALAAQTDIVVIVVLNAQQIDTVVLSGIRTSGVILSTAYRLFDLDYNV